jgi:hypothetical protein
MRTGRRQLIQVRSEALLKNDIHTPRAVRPTFTSNTKSFVASTALEEFAHGTPSDDFPALLDRIAAAFLEIDRRLAAIEKGQAE